MSDFPVEIELADGTMANGRYHKHLRTLTYGSGSSSEEVDLYTLEDGRKVVCLSWTDRVEQHTGYEEAWKNGSLAHL